MELDDAYANAPHIPDAEAYPARWAEKAQALRSKLGAVNRARLGLMYGHGTRNAIDLFLPLRRPEGLLVFVHGGYWLRFGREDWSHLAEGPMAHRWAVAMPSYDLCPRVRIADITRQIADAIAVAAHEVPNVPIRLAGHSAGGHLVSRMLAPDMLPEDVASRIEAVMPISPLCDLEPLLKTSMNAELGLDADSARAESPLHQPKPSVPVTVWVGAEERPVFLDQARWLSEAWGADLVEDAGRHHFDVIDGLEDPDSRMTKVVLGL
ncbi:Alpha/beta hydrolase family protein [Roseivivax sp. THAF40]|uniref:alpha/beta hydrolase n=1 Tax=unclassified Roseivivax TaxID=2639302 RepID=UPI001268643F|nr:MULTISPECIES: alpha/beta hydrolase [unclassified Roseivivax]QFS84577.1 Alpha/beta hydrolase family protein [Roseivivax sp. THAF197b]QFT48404.1 Alpha/beta hydrolase family protein [Roseivivax sp. THAF40]